MADPKYADLPGIVSAGWGPWGGAGRGVGPAGGVWGLGEYVGAAGLGPNCRVWGAAVGVWGGCEALLWGVGAMGYGGAVRPWCGVWGLWDMGGL